MSRRRRLAILAIALGALLAGGISITSGACLRRRTAGFAMFVVHGAIRNHYDAEGTLPDSWADLERFLSEHDARGVPKWVEIDFSVQVDDLARLFDADIAMNPLHQDFVHGLGAPPIELVRYRASCAWTTASANRWNRLLLHDIAIEIQMDRVRGGEGR